MNWFRMYVDARNDAKLRSLSDAEHRTWFNLLCYAAEREPRGSVTGVTSVTDVTDDLLLAIEVANGDLSTLNSTIDKLLKLRILVIDEDGLTFANFRTRQYDKPSDMPEETRRRKAAQRERERGDSRVPGSDGNVTPRDITPQNRTDTEQINNTPSGVEGDVSSVDDDGGKPKRPQTKYPDDFEAFWKSYPSGNGNKSRSYAQWKRIKPDAELAAEIMAGLDRWKASDRWHRGFVKAAETWLKDAYWSDPAPSPALGVDVTAPDISPVTAAIAERDRLLRGEWNGQREALLYGPKIDGKENLDRRLARLNAIIDGEGCVA